MATRATRLMLLGAVAAALWLAGVQETQAGPFDCLWGGPSAQTTYMPRYVPAFAARVFAAPAPAYAVPYAAYTVPAGPPCMSGACGTPAGTGATTYFMPQTVFRPVTHTVAMTGYLPVTYSDPCGGCPVVAYRPVVAYAPRVSLMPYTTYRMVASYGGAAWGPCAAPCAPMPCASYDPCATCPSALSCGAAASGCASCPGGATVTAPSQNGLLPAESRPQIDDRSAPPAKSFDQTPGPAEELRLKPDAKTETQRSSSPVGPRLPDPQNKTAVLPVRHAALVQTLRPAVPLTPVSQPAGGEVDDGWRPARP